MPGIGGVQSWSVGEIYPYHVVVKAEGSKGVVFAQGPSGKCAEHPFEGWDEFAAAHAAAERDAVAQKWNDYCESQGKNLWRAAV